MAALVITPANVKQSSGGTLKQVIFGGTVTAGQPVYKDSGGKYQAAENTTAAKAAVEGIALCNGAVDQPGVILIGTGQITLGNVLTVGDAYFVGDTAGAILEASELTSGDYVTLLGTSMSTTVLGMNIRATGAAVAGA